MKKFDEIWKEANEEADLKYDPKGALARSLFLYSALKKRIEPFLEKQQPEIPEVPPFVAEWLDSKPLYAINGSISVEVIEWSQKQTGYADLGMNISHLLKLKVNGYTVAKEKRFYLKHIEMSKRDIHHDYYAQIRNERFEHDSVETGMLPQSVITGVTFTQQEIDSMETGSYEQIEVEE